MKIAFTGGPSAGKTTISEVLVRTYPEQLSLVPEAASILFRGGFIRGANDGEVCCQQVAIYHVQKQLEEIVALRALSPHLICDRGSLDGLAYWPKSGVDFFKAIDSSMEKEIERYDWVIHLDVTPAHGYQSTQTRMESFKQAQDINQKVKEAWKIHPRRLIISNSVDFNEKVLRAVSLVNMIISGVSYTDIQNFLKKEASC
jgi:thymidylate kinase